MNKKKEDGRKVFVRTVPIVAEALEVCRKKTLKSKIRRKGLSQ